MDLRRVDDADDVTRVVKRQRHAEAVTAGRFHANMSLPRTHCREPGQNLSPAIGIVREGLALLSLASGTIRIQGLLGYVNSNCRLTHSRHHDT